jgi:valyl-tRNA synthetase
MNQEMPSRYDASAVEHAWYAKWEQSGLFMPRHDGRETYCITIPPPNITGSLHMGHALCYPLQDLFGRYKRLCGFDVLVLPGQDHAGIATQSVVEKMLRKEGTSGAQLGREKFLERVWAWRQESGDTILNQFRLLGCGFDWSRSRFTLDEAYAQAVLKVFIDWFNRGLIFRGKRVVNWDPVLQTSVSDIETLREVRKGKLYHVRYPFADGSGEVTIATTRPETMLADVAVAVHPSDARYTHLVGKDLVLPLVGRRIPLVADPYPDPEFGTGAVKITPSHDPNDYLVGVRQSLPMPVILDSRAKVVVEDVLPVADEAGRNRLATYAGLDRYEARKRIVADLEELGFLVRIEDHEIAMVISDRSGEVIEPLLSEQWFCDQKRLAEPVLHAMEKGEIRFHPQRFDRIFIDWLEGVREWCLSRQLWWGHRIPVYYTESGTAYAALSWEDAQKQAGDEKIVRQEDDVLDTWFSSGLWPFATLGWPADAADLAGFYPTQLLITDRNIINLWVARMAMMSYDLMGTRPFSDVMIYATVLNAKGQRMSKSLGTGVDPTEVIQTVGADALRWTLLSQTGDNQELRYSEKRTEEARNFANKIWNAVRFILLNVSQPPAKPAELTSVDRWLLSRLHSTIEEVTAAYESYDIQLACNHLYRFFWSDLCDWYIEIAKPRLGSDEERETPQWVLLTAIEAFLTMLHPVMPHLTEEVYSFLPLADKQPFLMQAAWPTAIAEWQDQAAESSIERIFEMTRAVRALRAEFGLAPGSAIEALYAEGDLEGAEPILKSQAWVKAVRAGRPENERFVSVSVAGIDLHLPIQGLIDPDKELARLNKERDEILSKLAPLQSRLQNPQFVERAKPEVVDKERALVQDLGARLEKVQERLALLQ